MSQPDPGLILQTLNAFQQTEALKAAIELDIFTHIADGAASAAQIAGRCSAVERTTRILCDFLVVQGFLTKSGSEYGLSPTSAAFLNKHSAMYMGAMSHFLTHEFLRSSFHDLASTVRHGGARVTEMLEPDHPAWVEFARSMSGFLGMVADLLAQKVAKTGPQKVLDIAAGHGMFGLMVAKHNPSAEVFALDWAPVLEVAKENATRLGLASRFHTIAGSAFQTDLGTGYDLVLVPNFLHHFDAPTNVAFLKRVKAALKPGGVVAISEFVPNPDRVSPPIPAAFSLQMLATPAGDAYTLAELSQMLSEAHFHNVEAQALVPSPQTLVLATAS